MYKIDTKGNIEITRGDILPLTITAQNDDGSDYVFQVGDVVRFKVFKRRDCGCVEIQKDTTITKQTTEALIDLVSNDTKIGNLINRPTDYWYEVELNPDTAPQTIIGYDKKDGAKIFTLLPEGDDIND